MTWKAILERGTLEDFIQKAEKQNFVYVLYEVTPPCLPVDMAYSLYEISSRLGIPLRTVESAYHLGVKLRGKYFIKKDNIKK